MNLDRFHRIFLVALTEHLQLYPAARSIKARFAAIGAGEKTKVVALDAPTSNQPETVAEAIRKEGIEGAIAIKDCDNYFVLDARPENFVATFHLGDTSRVSAEAKSYVLTDGGDRIAAIAEKKVISETFCCGCYGFRDAADFVRVFTARAGEKDLYVSEIIAALIGEAHEFVSRPASGYEDWGNLELWNRYKTRVDRAV